MSSDGEIQRRSYSPRPWAWSIAIIATTAVVMVIIYAVAVVDARFTHCPEIDRGTQDGISLIGQGVSLWPVGAECHDPVGNVSYVHETAQWLGIVLPAVGITAIAAALAVLFLARRERRFEREIET